MRARLIAKDVPVDRTRKGPLPAHALRLGGFMRTWAQRRAEEHRSCRIRTLPPTRQSHRPNSMVITTELGKHSPKPEELVISTGIGGWVSSGDAGWSPGRG